MKIFISSTTYDLLDFRQLIIDRLTKMGHYVIYHEAPAFPKYLGHHSHDQCLLTIDECDLVICIINSRYGGYYSGNFKDDFEDICFTAGHHAITVKRERLSITWCELIRAVNQKKHLITFARQKALDEKLTRRKNQDYKDFVPAFVDKTEIFDLLDWITHLECDNWIIPYESIVDFEIKLLEWVRGLDNSTVTSPQKANRKMFFVVEGETDQLIIKSIIKKMNLLLDVSIIISNGKNRMLKNMSNIIVSNFNKYDNIIFLVDSDIYADADNGFEATFKSISQESDKLQLFQAQPTIEYWLLALISPEKYINVIQERANSNIYDLINQGIEDKLDRISKHNMIQAVFENEAINIEMACKVSNDFKSFIDFLKQGIK